MNKYKLGTALIGAMIASAGMATAGGIERSHSPYAILWEKGNYAELSFGNVNPSVSGKAAASLGGASSGDMMNSYNALGLAIKYQINDQLDVALVLDQPVGADLSYPNSTGTPAYPLNGSVAEVKSNAISALARYKLDGGFSVHGGVKVQRTKGRVNLTLPMGGNIVKNAYRMNTSSETDVGYIIGAAYERPDIALRVALTYQSAITHDFTAMESVGGGAFTTSTFDTKVPQSLTLDFQSGVAADTLVFGSIRWRDWSEFAIDPKAYAAAPISGGNLVDYAKDVVTYTLGVGRKFNENFSGSISIAYEGKTGLPVGNLGPHDGMKSITIGGVYTQDNMKITAGVSYVELGAATTKSISSRFEKNKAIGVGVKVGYSF